MGINVLQELSAEQTKFKAKITEDRFKYKNQRPCNKSILIMVCRRTSRGRRTGT